MPPFIDLKGITFRDGTTDGAAEVEARQGQPLKVSGSGKINNAQALWKNTAFSARGSYKFSQDGVVFDPLFIGKDGGTDITCRGKWNEENLDFSLKGALETKHLNTLVKMPFDMAGIVRLDGELHLNDGILNASGDVNMDDLVFEIPGYMKKEKGTKSKAQVKLSKKGPDVIIDDLSYDLENINVRARGTITDRKKINADIALNAHDIGRAGEDLLPAGGDDQRRCVVKPDHKGPGTSRDKASSHDGECEDQEWFSAFTGFGETIPSNGPLC